MGCKKDILSVVDKNLDGQHINDCGCNYKLQKRSTITLTREQWLELIKRGLIETSTTN